MAANTARPRGRTFLHVGAPKSGTTYLQERLRLNARTLRAAGIHYPVAGPWSRSSVDPAFRAALDLIGQQWGVPAGQIDGRWDRVARSARRHRGTSLISHEVLAGARPAAVERAAGDLAGQELHLVYTMRDLSRSLPGAWQESIKQGRTWTYAHFLARSRRGRTWFMRALDPTRVLSNWGAVVPPERIHVVVTPPPGAPEHLLWERFAGTVGFAPECAGVLPSARNPSLGPVEAQLLRTVNCQFAEREDLKAHRGPREQFLVNDVILPGLRARATGHDAAGRVQLPPDAHEWVDGLTDEWIGWISGRGFDVVGDLDELRPRRGPGAEWVDPDECADPVALTTAARALAALMDEAAARPVPLRVRLQRRRAHAAGPRPGTPGPGR